MISPHVGVLAGYTGGGAPPAFTPAAVANQTARWDLEESTITTSGGEITVIGDLEGTSDLEGPWNGVDQPDDVAADTRFTGRRACSLSNLVSIEDVGYDSLPDTGADSTFAMVLVFDALVAGDSVFEIGGTGGTISCYIGVDGGTHRWFVTDGTDEYSGGTVEIDRPYLLVFESNGASSELKIDGASVIANSLLELGDLNYLGIGYESLASAQGGQFAWTLAMVTSGIMSDPDQTALLAWAETECGVGVDPWTPADLSPEMWLRADRGHVYGDGASVAAWANQGTSSSALDVAQGTGAYQPVFDQVHADYNNRPVMVFNGSKVIYVAASTAWHLASESGSMTIVVIGRTSTSAGALEAILLTRNVSTLGGFDLQIRDGNTCRARWVQSGAGVTLTDNGANGTTTPRAYASVLTGGVTTTPDNGICIVHGALGSATTADLTAAVAASSNRELCIGGSSTTIGTLVGEVAEVILLKRVLTSDEDDDLTAYLNARYGFSLSGVTQ